MWLWPNLLSLDAPIIAVLWLQLFAVSEHVTLSYLTLLALALVVWLIYVSDRLFDGLRSNPAPMESARHRFYRAHRKVLLPLLLGVLGLTCCICLELDTRTLLYGSVLMFMMAGYFVLVHWLVPRRGLRLPKEAIVAIGFGAGTFFPVLIHAQNFSAEKSTALVFFVVLCWLNVLLIEYAEWVRLRRHSEDMPHRSTLTGGKHLCAIGIALAIASTGLMACSGFRGERLVLLAIFLSALFLATLGSYWRKLSIDAVRVLADATLLTPAFVLLFLHR